MQVLVAEIYNCLIYSATAQKARPLHRLEEPIPHSQTMETSITIKKKIRHRSRRLYGTCKHSLPLKKKTKKNLPLCTVQLRPSTIKPVKLQPLIQNSPPLRRNETGT
ncbi:hypothetical protein IscW_ISCW005209 [Ixodes scapularis]|uniref:Uncharacterized protein n=1 Tax=Ixodes scapularis TaxID=6945 RepID=B7PE40_IXOSC|nr:hypothetical protein IscW_ISCW005209 [Ixodes scapularis]|eukprot:XP_002399943.1 hypothetical protein IscW_ISCW005209 [Ixodes scapularis]